MLRDPGRYPAFLAHLERWETLTKARPGWAPATRCCGRTARSRWGVAEVVEFDEACDLASIDITGVTQRGRFRLRDAGAGRTVVTFRLAYRCNGGLLGLVADRVAAFWVGRSLDASLKNLRRLVES